MIAVSIWGVKTGLLRPHVTLCVPARDEAATIASVVRTLRRAARRASVCIEEILVVDDRSSDATAQRAADAGARVVSTQDICAVFGGSSGKGDALWAGLRECRTNLIGFVDADLREIDAGRLLGMFTALESNPNLQLVKGTFERATRRGVPAAGRVTTLTARPLLSLLFPQIAHLREPLGGIFAGRTEVLGSLWLDCDYGVDVGIVLDIAAEYGSEAIAEFDVGRIRHRQRPLDELSGMAEQVARAILSRHVADEIIDVTLTSRREPPRRLVEGGASQRTLR